MSHGGWADFQDPSEILPTLFRDPSETWVRSPLIPPSPEGGLETWRASRPSSRHRCGSLVSMAHHAGIMKACLKRLIAHRIWRAGALTNITSARDTTMTTESTKADLKKWLAIRKEAGLQIDPETAEVDWNYAQTLDPYGVDPDLSEEYQQVGRAYFARSPGSNVWVWFGDLPEATREALWKRNKRNLAFPAGPEGQEDVLHADKNVDTQHNGAWPETGCRVRGSPFPSDVLWRLSDRLKCCSPIPTHEGLASTRCLGDMIHCTGTGGFVSRRSRGLL
jgi:hypothetical protein